jgi:hypothetical protein
MPCSDTQQGEDCLPEEAFFEYLKEEQAFVSFFWFDHYVATNPEALESTVLQNANRNDAYQVFPRLMDHKYTLSTPNLTVQIFMEFEETLFTKDLLNKESTQEVFGQIRYSRIEFLQRKEGDPYLIFSLAPSLNRQVVTVRMQGNQGLVEVLLVLMSVIGGLYTSSEKIARIVLEVVTRPSFLKEQLEELFLVNNVD